MTTQKFSLIFRFVGDLFTFRVLSHTILAGLYCQLVDLEWLYMYCMVYSVYSV